MSEGACRRLSSRRQFAGPDLGAVVGGRNGRFAVDLARCDGRVLIRAHWPTTRLPSLRPTVDRRAGSQARRPGGLGRCRSIGRLLFEALEQQRLEFRRNRLAQPKRGKSRRGGDLQIAELDNRLAAKRRRAGQQVITNAPQ